MTVKVRFAPSPTGFLHIGSARTALFNYLFARHHGGKFVIRIEDTDKERSTKEFEKDILDGLEWLGFKSDEPLVYQAARIETHKKYIQVLLDKGLAYKDAESPAIYFKVPTEGETIIQDVVKGDISFQNKDFKDQVILKSDGTVTYNFGVVIDDAEMGITHVIRGEDHISNTPKQIFFYQALGFPLPKFAHIPLILGPDKSKLSKRHGATSIIEYRKQGYTAESINNYLALLGWSPADNEELMDLETLCKKFDLDRASKSNSIFDIVKLNWINGQKLRHYSTEKLVQLLDSYLPEGFKKLEVTIQHELINAVRDNLELLGDVSEPLSVFFKEPQYKPEDEQLLKSAESNKVFSLFSGKIDGIYIGSYEEQYAKANAVIEELVKETGFKKGQILKPLRVMLTGEGHGPNLKNVIVLLGKAKVVERVTNALRS